MTSRRTKHSERIAQAAFRLTPIARSVQLALLPGLLTGLSPATLHAAPAGGAVQAGQAYIAQNASKSVTAIHQGSHRVAIDWQSFNVKSHELVQFHQPSATASALNRIFDQRPSEIFGQVKANGQIMLMNPNGVFFKPGARVNVGSLIAGAMQIGIDDFMSGNYKLEALENAQGRVVNQGRIEAAPGGDVTLVGQSIANEGVIVATAGRVNLIAGDQVTVDFDGDGLLKFTVDKEVIDNATSLDDQISNTGEIIANGGDVLITASAAEGVFKNAINNGGAIEAARIDTSGGHVMLVGMGSQASVLNTGRINTSAGTATDRGGSIDIAGTNITNTGLLLADATGGDGGSIHVESSDTTLSSGTVSAASSEGAGGAVKLLGERVGLIGIALVDVSGDTGGGEALIGGDFQGANSDVTNATQSYVGADASIKADAEATGDGGKVIVWADETTRYFGSISATAGAQSGDGGNVEVSGKENLTFDGAVDASAANGEVGTLLLDPDDFHVTNGGPPDSPVVVVATLDPTNPFTAPNGGGEFYGEQATIEAAADGAAVTIMADGSVLFDDDLAGGSLELTMGGTITATTGAIDTRGMGITTEGAVLNLNAATTVTTGTLQTSGVADNVATGTGTITITSAGGSFGDVKTDGAAFIANVTSGNLTQTGTIDDSAAPAVTSVTKQGAGTLTLSAANGYTGTTTVSAGTLSVSNATGLGTTAAGTTVADGATLNVDGVAIGAEAITVQGTGVGAAGALQASMAGSAIGGGITLLGDTSFGGTGGLALVGVIDDVASSFSIEKVGAGTVQLEAANTYDGTTTVTAGTLAVTHQSALGTNGGGVGVDGTTVASDARLTFAIVTPQTVSEELSITGDGPGTSEALLHSTANTLTLDGGITLAGDAVISASAGAGFINVDGIISGPFGIDKQGAGTVVLNAANTYSGTTTVTLGTLQLGTAAERIADTSALVVNGGTFDMNSLAETVASLAGSGGAVDSAGAATLTAGDASNTNFMGSINGLVALTKVGTGNLTLSGASAYSCVTNVNAGILTAGNNLALGVTGGATIVDGDGGDDATLSIAAGIDIGTEGLTLNGAGTGSIGALKASGAGAIAGGAITLGSASSIGADAASSLQVDGIITGTMALTKVGTGTVEMTASNALTTATSTITVAAGTLTASDPGALGDTAAGTSVTAGATLNINNVDVGTEGLTLNGAGVASAGALVGTGAGAIADGAITVATASSIGAGGGATLDLGGVITSAVAITKVGAGIVELNADNSGTISSTIAVNAGTLTAGDAGALGDGTATTVAAGATLEIDNVNIGAEALTLDGGKLVGTGAGAVADGAVTLTADSDVGGAGTLAIGGIVSGAFGIDKQDAGTVELGGVNTYTGTTNVQAGTLRITDEDALGTGPGAGTVVSAGAVLDIQTPDGSNINEALSIEGVNLTTGSLVYSTAGASTTTLSGGVTLTAAATVDVQDMMGTLAIDTNPITGAFTLTKIGTGTLQLGVAGNLVGGTLDLDAGTLALGLANVLDTTTALDLAGGTTLNLNDNNQQLASVSGTGTVTNDTVLAANTARLTIAGDGGNFTGTLTDSADDFLEIEKSTGGTQIFAPGTGDYDGALLVTGGTLEAQNANAFGSATGQTTASTGTLDLNGLALASTETINLNGAGAAGAGALTATGASSIAATNTLTLAGNSTIGSAGMLTLNTAIGGAAVNLTKVGAGTLILGVANGYTGTTAINDGTLQLNVADVLADGAAVTLAGTGVLDLNDNSDTVGSIASAAAGTQIDLGTATLTAGGDGTTTAFAGTIDGATGNLTKEGAGTLTLLNAANSYTGATSINAGTLAGGAVDVLDTSSGVSIAGGAFLDLAGNDQTVNGLTSTGTVTNSGAAATLTVNTASGTSTFNGNIVNGAGATALTKSGANILALGGANTYSGATTINAGTLRADSGTAVGDASAVTITGTGIFDVNDNTETVGSIASAAAGTQIDLGSGTLTVGDATSTTFAGTIIGATGNLTKVGAGTLTLSNSGNSYSGATMINVGTLAGGAVDVVDQTTVTIAGIAFLDLGGFNQTVSGLLGTGTVLNSGGAAALIVDTSAGTTTFNGNIIGGTTGLTKIGANTLGLGGANTYGGVTTINVGTLRADSGTAVGDGSAVTVNGTAIFDVNGQTETVGSIAGVAGTMITLGAGTLAAGAVDAFDQSSVTIAAGAFLDLASFDQMVTGLGGTGTVTNSVAGTAILTVDTSGGGSVFNGNVVDGGGTMFTALTKAGANTLGLGGTNTYSGATTINAGTLRADSGTSVGDGSAVTITGTGIFDVNGNTETVGSIASAAAGTQIDLGSGTLSAGGDGSTTMFDGTIIGTGGLTKAGAGTLTLTNMGNAYTGTTSITGGTLQVGASGVIADGSAVTLSGTGVFDVNNFMETVASIASAAAGTQIDLGSGTLTVGDATSTTFAGTIIGATGNLTKVGAGTLTLSNSGNSYSGATMINVGTLAGGAVDVVDQTTVTIAGIAFLDLGGFNQTVSGLLGTGTVLNSGGAAALIVDTSAGTTTFNGNIIGGTTGLTKIGANTLGLGGANTYGGATTINVGLAGGYGHGGGRRQRGDDERHGGVRCERSDRDGGLDRRCGGYDDHARRGHADGGRRRYVDDVRGHDHGYGWAD